MPPADPKRKPVQKSENKDGKFWLKLSKNREMIHSFKLDLVVPELNPNVTGEQNEAADTQTCSSPEVRVGESEQGSSSGSSCCRGPSPPWLRTRWTY